MNFAQTFREGLLLCCLSIVNVFSNLNYFNIWIVLNLDFFYYCVFSWNRDSLHSIDHARTHATTHICICANIHSNTQTHTHTCIGIRTHNCPYTCTRWLAPTHSHTCIISLSCTPVHLHICAFRSTHANSCIHTKLHSRVHTHTHAHAQTYARMKYFHYYMHYAWEPFRKIYLTKLSYF